MFVAVARLTLSIPEAGSLKSKRQVVHKVLDRVKARFNVSIAEVADNDLWQKATLGLAAVANEHAFAQESIDKVLHFIEELYVAPVIHSSSEVIPLGEELFGADDGTSFGSAARGTARTLAEAELEADWRGDRTLAEAEAAAAGRRGGMRTLAEAEAAERRGRPRQQLGHPRPTLSEPERQRAIEDLRRRLREGRASSFEDDDNEGPDHK